MTAASQPHRDPSANETAEPIAGEEPLVDRPEIAVTPVATGSTERSVRRHRRRMSSRVPLGAAIGVAAGATLGAILGAIGFTSTAGILGSALTGAIAIGALGAFWGGMASLESTDAGAEPSQAREPLSANAGVPPERDALPRRPEAATQPPRRRPH